MGGRAHLGQGSAVPSTGGKSQGRGGSRLGYSAQPEPLSSGYGIALPPERVGERWRKFQNRLIPVRLQACLLLAPSSPLLRLQNLHVRPQINLKIELQLDELMSTSKFTGA